MQEIFIEYLKNLCFISLFFQVLIILAVMFISLLEKENNKYIVPFGIFYIFLILTMFALIIYHILILFKQLDILVELLVKIKNPILNFFPQLGIALILTIPLPVVIMSLFSILGGIGLYITSKNKGIKLPEAITFSCIISNLLFLGSFTLLHRLAY